MYILLHFLILSQSAAIFKIMIQSFYLKGIAECHRKKTQSLLLFRDTLLALTHSWVGNPEQVTDLGFLRLFQ